MHNEILHNSQLSSEQNQALKSLEQELQESRAQLKKLEAKIIAMEEQAQSERTILTRPEFNREVARMLAFDERYGGVSSVLYFDIASLDGLSARQGQIVAAEAARIIAHVLTHCVRRSDIVGRLAVDEFGVMLVRCNNENAWKKGRELASSIKTAMETAGGANAGLNISFGAYTFSEDENVAMGLKKAALAITKLDDKN